MIFSETAKLFESTLLNLHPAMVAILDFQSTTKTRHSDKDNPKKSQQSLLSNSLAVSEKIILKHIFP
jgi:hypothetical protein